MLVCTLFCVLLCVETGDVGAIDEGIVGTDDDDCTVVVGAFVGNELGTPFALVLCDAALVCALLCVLPCVETGDVGATDGGIVGTSVEEELDPPSTA